MRGDQLQLPLPPAPRSLGLPVRIAPMEATPIDTPFDDAGYFFEPWWPGVRALAFVEAGAARLQVTGLADPAAAVPELTDLPQQLAADGCVLDGTLLVLDDQGRPDPELLRRRLDSSWSGSVSTLPGRAAYVASDLLWCDGTPWLRRPFKVRRDRLTSVLPDGDRAIVGRGYPRDGTLVAEALVALGIDGLSARRMSARYRSGRADDAWLRASLTPPEPRPHPTLALILRLPLELE